MSDNYTEETQPLWKLLRNDAFRFIIVRYNHYSLIKRLQKDLNTYSPDKPIPILDAEKITFNDIYAAYKNLQKGILVLENFEDVLIEETTINGIETTTIATNNERRRKITAGLNLRRDTLAKSPIALIVLVASTVGELYAKRIMKKMPDLWSFRSWIVDLEMEIALSSPLLPTLSIALEKTSLGGATLAEKEEELSRLMKNVNELPEEENALESTIYPQIIALLKDIGRYDEVLAFLDIQFTATTIKQEQALLLGEKGDIYLLKGDLTSAKTCFEEALEIAKLEKEKYLTGVCYSKLGEVEEYLMDLDTALSYYHQYHELQKELYSEFPENNVYEKHLAISCSRLGDVYTRLGNLKKALTFFEKEVALFESLYKKNPLNVEHKIGLSISYERIGNTHSTLGKLEKALRFFEKCNEIRKALCENYPLDLNYRNGLAISYGRLADIHSTLGNLKKATNYFNKEIDLFLLLHKNYSSNLRYKNGLALSYINISRFNRDKMKDDLKAKIYLQKAMKLWKELARVAPNYKIFQEYLDRTKEELQKLA